MFSPFTNKVAIVLPYLPVPFTNVQQLSPSNCFKNSLASFPNGLSDWGIYAVYSNGFNRFLYHFSNVSLYGLLWAGFF